MVAEFLHEEATCLGEAQTSVWRVTFLITDEAIFEVVVVTQEIIKNKGNISLKKLNYRTMP